MPLGNYLSQYFANLYLAYFDHWVKEQLKCKFYFRYADDIVILSDNKEFLHDTLKKIKVYLKDKLALDIKPNYQVFPVEERKTISCTFQISSLTYGVFFSFVTTKVTMRQILSTITPSVHCLPSGRTRSHRNAS